MVLDRKRVACPLRVGGEVLPQVEEFKYLGVLFTSEGKMEREIDRRIGAASAVMHAVGVPDRRGEEGAESKVAKLSIYRSIYVPTLTYGHELWVMTERTRSRIQAAEMSFLRRVAGRSLRDRAQNCSGLRTCAECLERAECGWCGDPSNTGRGVCMEGSYRGPLKPARHNPGPRDRERLRDRDMVLDQGLCSSDRGYNWAFIQCPACQCNGHSRCVNGSVCEHCGNLTAGTHCQSCMPGYYGDPINGGKCNALPHSTKLSPLLSNQTAPSVEPDKEKSGVSHKWKHVSVTATPTFAMSTQESASAPPKASRETSVNYNLLIDYQFTFSLLQEDDRYYTAINFMATPEQANKNLDMSINASNNFNLNITWSLSSTAGTISGEEMPIIARTNIKEHRDSFSCEKFNFRLHHNITFYVYVSNFSWPIKIQMDVNLAYSQNLIGPFSCVCVKIAFSQHNSIMDLVQFFVTFFSCFLSLLLVAAVVWKIKQTCWASRRRELNYSNFLTRHLINRCGLKEKEEEKENEKRTTEKLLSNKNLQCPQLNCEKAAKEDFLVQIKATGEDGGTRGAPAQVEQLMRERQQMASRPFASVAVALEVGGDQEELLQLSGDVVSFPVGGVRVGIAANKSLSRFCGDEDVTRCPDEDWERKRRDEGMTRNKRAGRNNEGGTGRKEGEMNRGESRKSENNKQSDKQSTRERPRRARGRREEEEKTRRTEMERERESDRERPLGERDRAAALLRSSSRVTELLTPISKGAPSHPAEETHFAGRLYPHGILSFRSSYPKFMTIGEGGNVD
ncbi:hypothetical protein L3Q82_001869 [Scortum barcoo]|uniref:Uncharacterized protein n=1 Tax=Scortum barcoo TaxID=214431 RepID=A0ACB8W4V7_9TELE|nr:hypothetical protein L3Q82_001869 [Scortum barcoo]